MIQSLGLGYGPQETEAQRVKQPGGRVAAGLEEAVEPAHIAPEEAAVELLNGKKTARGDGEETETVPAKQPVREVTERFENVVGPEDTAPEKAAVEPPSRKDPGLERDTPDTEAEPAERPINKVAERFKEAAGLEHIAPEEVAIEPLSRIVFHTDPSGLGADRFRYLRMRLRERSNAGKLKTILVTSPLPLDGKSTIALNLATALAERGENTVLLLEADLYHPVLADRLGLRAGPGFAECLASGLDPLSVLRHVVPLGLYLLPGGKPLANPGNFLHSDALAGVIQALSPHFKWIVIDSPPVAPLADALALARQADASLLVVRAGQTPREAVDAAIEALGAKHVLGVVLNGVEGLAQRYSKYSKYYRSSTAGGDRTGKTAR